MNTNRKRPDRWPIGSFTKNFRWGSKKGLSRLHDAINVGFDGQVLPVPRKTFLQRLDENDFIKYIPANFFLFNYEIRGIDYIAADELVFQALKFPHSEKFDKLALFSLLLSEVGKWKGASKDQSHPSEWARAFALKIFRETDEIDISLMSAKDIEIFLASRVEFNQNTRKLSTNLSHLFREGRLDLLPSNNNDQWVSDAIFLALDRFYLKEKPEKPSVNWAINTLDENDTLDLSGEIEEIRIEIRSKVANLYVDLLESDSLKERGSADPRMLIAALSREPKIYKILPEACRSWLSNRLFVEIHDDIESAEEDTGFDTNEYEARLLSLDNLLPSNKYSADEIIALFRD